MVLVALSVTVLLGFLGLATDVGVLWATKRKAQTAADAAAVAGANATLGSDSSAYSTAATDVATLNGFTNGANGTTITVSQPSPSGYPSGTYVQVNITKSMSTYFLGVLGYRTIPITVSALAGNTSGPNTVIALNGSGSGRHGQRFQRQCGLRSYKQFQQFVGVDGHEWRLVNRRYGRRGRRHQRHRSIQYQDQLRAGAKSFQLMDAAHQYRLYQA